MSAQAEKMRDVGPTESELLSIGKLQFLASFCPKHQRMPAFALARIFYPALNNNCVRFFENEHGKTAAALIWARLSDEVSNRMLRDRIPPKEDEWASGGTLWFLDLLAPFGHGRIVAREIARNPPPEAFYFARLDSQGGVQRVVCGDATRKQGERMQTWAGLPEQEG